MPVVDEGNPGCSSNSHFREQNKVADALAKLGLAAMDFGTTHILFTPPPTVEALVQADNLGSSTLRSTSLNLINLVRRDVDTNNLDTTTTSVQGNSNAEPLILKWLRLILRPVNQKKKKERRTGEGWRRDDKWIFLFLFC